MFPCGILVISEGCFGLNLLLVYAVRLLVLLDIEGTCLICGFSGLRVLVFVAVLGYFGGLHLFVYFVCGFNIGLFNLLLFRLFDFRLFVWLVVLA